MKYALFLLLASGFAACNRASDGEWNTTQHATTKAGEQVRRERIAREVIDPTSFADLPKYLSLVHVMETHDCYDQACAVALLPLSREHRDASDRKLVARHSRIGSNITSLDQLHARALPAFIAGPIAFVSGALKTVALHRSTANQVNVAIAASTTLGGAAVTACYGKAYPACISLAVAAVIGYVWSFYSGREKRDVGEYGTSHWHMHDLGYSSVWQAAKGLPRNKWHHIGTNYYGSDTSFVFLHVTENGKVTLHANGTSSKPAISGRSETGDDKHTVGGQYDNVYLSWNLGNNYRECSASRNENDIYAAAQDATYYMTYANAAPFACLTPLDTQGHAIFNGFLTVQDNNYPYNFQGRDGDDLCAGVMNNNGIGFNPDNSDAC